MQNNINGFIKPIYEEAARCFKEDRLRGKNLIDEVINMTINEVPSKCQYLMSSVYNLMQKHTLADHYFADDVMHTKKLNEADIMSELKSKIIYDVPDKIEPHEIEKTMNRLITAGAIVFSVSGVVTIFISKIPKPISICVLLFGIFLFGAGKAIQSYQYNRNTDKVINSYLESVAKSIFQWVNSINDYYDNRINEIKREG